MISTPEWYVYWHEYAVVLELAHTTLTACMYSAMPAMMTLRKLLPDVSGSEFTTEMPS